MHDAPLTFAPDPSGAVPTGSTLLRAAMADACATFPDVFGDLDLGPPARFKRTLADRIVRFEARRAASPRRVEVARGLAAYVPDRTLLRGEPLAAAMSRAAAAPEPVGAARPGAGAAGWTPTVDHGGRRWVGPEFATLADALLADHELTEPAARALRWAARDRIDLTGERFVLLGAGAELAPTRYLLEAGARVVGIDPRPPSVGPTAGEWVPVCADLLADPAAACAAVAAEAAHGPVHLGLYAYAPGGGRELLLTTVMNAIAAALPPDRVRSVSMWVSPTTPGEALPEDQRGRQLRRDAAPRWQRALARARVLREPAHHLEGDVAIARSIVPLQGPTYLAAQYLGKMTPAEVWAVDRHPARVSANVAGITATRSLSHPLFEAGFLAAPTFGIRVFTPELTRVLATLLMVHDLFAPSAPSADPTGGPAAQARRVGAQSVHGGVRSIPFELDPTIRVAAALGLSRKPSLLLRLRG
ncbi:MAG: hypothetical protein ABMA64_06735 [Myxococcota bacterium]